MNHTPTGGFAVKPATAKKPAAPQAPVTWESMAGYRARQQPMNTPNVSDAHVWDLS